MFDFILTHLTHNVKSYIWVTHPPTLNKQNFNINIIGMECYEEISAIGQEVETFPVTFDFSIAFKSNYLNTVPNFPIALTLIIPRGTCG